MQEKRRKVTEHMNSVLGGDALLLVPAAPGPAPYLETPPEELDSYRSRLIFLTCIAGLAKLPQVAEVRSMHLQSFHFISLPLNRQKKAQCSIFVIQ